jgi:hypothetical protein
MGDSEHVFRRSDISEDEDAHAVRAAATNNHNLTNNHNDVEPIAAFAGAN